MKLLADLSDPKKVLDELNMNEQSVAQETIQSIKGSEHGIYGTLQGIKEGLNPYINWGFFIAWTAALILLMYNGIMLMVKSGTGSGDVAKIKGRFINIAIGVIVISSIYIILKLIVWTIGFITGS